MNRIPEPHELADAYYAAQDEAWAREIAGATCEMCEHYTGSPDEWARVPHGWCSECEEHVLADASVEERCPDSYEPREPRWI